MAALPAYAAACAGVVASWTDEYASRAWCRVDLLMAYAFMTAGDKVLVLPHDFVDEGQPRVAERRVAVADPAEGQLTNPNDTPVIAALRGVAERSTPSCCASS